MAYYARFPPKIFLPVWLLKLMLGRGPWTEIIAFAPNAETSDRLVCQRLDMRKPAHFDTCYTLLLLLDIGVPESGLQAGHNPNLPSFHPKPRRSRPLPPRARWVVLSV